MKKGWFNESYRHYLAAKGIRTSYYARRRSSIPLDFENPLKNRKYPVTPKEAKRVVESNPNSEGITKIVFQNPKDKHQKDAYAQYMRGDRKIAIFSQPVEKFGEKHYFVEKNHRIEPKDLKNLVLKKVIPHEEGHYLALKDCPTDKNIKMAEARAEAARHGDDYKDDKVVKTYIGASLFA